MAQLPSPEDVARIFGLSTGDGDLVEAKILTDEQAAEAFKMCNTVLASTDVASIVAFWASLITTYLPSLIDSVLRICNAGVDRKNHATLSALLVYTHRASLKTYQSNLGISRFVRIFPGRVVELYEALAKTLSSPPDILLEYQLGGRLTSNFYVPILKVLAILSEEICTQLHRVPRRPDLPPLVLQRLTSLLPTFKRLGETDRTNFFLATLAQLSKQRFEADHPKFRASAMKASWWSCETKIRSSSGEVHGACAGLVKGKEMETCSRCLAVRYCSPDHQRLDWKRHKKECFAAKW